MAQLYKRKFYNIELKKQFKSIVDSVNNHDLSKLSMGEIMQKVAKKFLGATYKAGLLEKFKKEQLFISFEEFDCVLFVETVLAITRSITLNDSRYRTFTKHLQEQRYINGFINGYCSRLHYFSDWINDNQKRGSVKNITAELGGIKFDKKLYFMSHNRIYYSKLANNEINYQSIIERENKINNIALKYIPNNKVKQIYHQLNPGDIISVATNIDGLDVTHTGLIYQTIEGNIDFIHASPAGQVTLAKDLQTYVIDVKNSVGIIVTRPVDIRLTTKKNDHK
ncbi:MAG: N-acetylmuramoyl-L-alanine amidase-like domain-containing protein [cyanobacterium endosymbiont of Rhopalodia sterrenbergii]